MAGDSEALDALAQRVIRLENSVHVNRAAPAPGRAHAGIEDLAARVSKIEALLAEATPKRPGRTVQADLSPVDQHQVAPKPVPRPTSPLETLVQRLSHLEALHLGVDRQR